MAKGAGTLIKNGVALAVGFVVVALLVAALIPEAVNDTVDVNTTGAGWGNLETTLWELLPMAYVLGPLLFFLFVAISYARE